MPNIPPTALAIGALAVFYIVIRIWASRAEERRRMAHDERMMKLIAEREAMGASSLGAVVGDPAAKAEPTTEPTETVKIRCRACKVLNDESAEKCAACGAEL